MESDGEHFLAYYLPKEDETAEIFLEQRRSGEEVEVRCLRALLHRQTILTIYRRLSSLSFVTMKRLEWSKRFPTSSCWYLMTGLKTSM